MPVPQLGIDQLSQRAPRSPAWFGQLIMFAATLFVITLAIFLGIRFGYQPYLNSRIAGLNARIAQFGQEVPVAEQDRIAQFYSQVVNLRGLLGKHVATSGFLVWLERTTVRDVALTKVHLNVTNRQVAISALARTMPDVASQLAVYQGDAAVERVDFRNVTQTATGWQFDVTLYLKPGFLSQVAQLP